MGEGVVNVRDYRVGPRLYDLPEDVAYVGRGGGRIGLPRSPHANPYRVGTVEPSTGDRLTRAGAIALFRRYALGQLAADPAWLDPLIGKTLACHCTPLECHAEVLAELRAGRVADLASSPLTSAPLR